MIKFLALAFTSTALIGAPALAADTPPAASKPAAVAPVKPGKTDKKANPEEKLICARETSTDSFLTKRVCRTQAQIEADRRAAEQLDNDRQLLGGRPDTVPGR
jgi:hypothetical protein